MCALHDILSLVLTRHYFKLFSNVPENDDNSRSQRDLLARECQDTIQKSWMAKRNSAKQAAAVLLSSQQRLMKIINTGGGNPENFHVQLSNLRQRWKIRKQTNTNRYLGDLSFRSGSTRKVSSIDRSKKKRNLSFSGIVVSDQNSIRSDESRWTQTNTKFH